MEFSTDATARAPQRITPAISSADSGNDENETTPDSHESAWSNHSQVEPQQLSPRLRHYVELVGAVDEIWRGTATFDGLPITWAVSEDLAA